MTSEVPTQRGADRSDPSRPDRNRQVRGDERRDLTEYVTAEYDRGRSIRDIAASIGRSYGFVHRLLAEAGVDFRTRGGARKGSGK